MIGQRTQVRAQNTRLEHIADVSIVLEISWNELCSVFEGIYLNWNPSLFSNRLEFHG